MIYIGLKHYYKGKLREVMRDWVCSLDKETRNIYRRILVENLF
jgi:hypothetical protein